MSHNSVISQGNEFNCICIQRTFIAFNVICQSEFVNVAKMSKPLRSLPECKTARRQTVITITREMTSGRGMSLKTLAEHRQKGKTEHSTAGNYIGWTLRREMNDDG